MNRDDRRFKKTEKALCGALSELIEEKPIFKITIDELVDRADIHRSTFYTHYQDIFDLYHTLKETFFDMLRKTVKEDSTHNYTNQYAACIDYLMENKQLAKLFLGNYTDPDINLELGMLLKDQILAISVFEDQIKEIPESWHYLCAYHAGGIIAIIRYWVSNNFCYSKTDLINQLEKLDKSFDSAFY